MGNLPEKAFDPRHIITPDAFSVSDQVLGLPLATGRRRLAAFAVDGVLVAVLAGLGWQVLGVLLGFFFFRVATKRTPKPTAATGMARAARGIGQGFRVSVGCLGAVILFSTFIVASGALTSLFRGDSGPPNVVANAGVFGQLISAGFDVGAMRTADTPEEAEAAATDIAALLLRQDDMDIEEAANTVAGLLPDSLVDDRDAFIERVEDRLRDQVRAASGVDAEVPEDSVPLLEALDLYRTSLTAIAPTAANPGDSVAAAEAERQADAIEAAQLRIQEAVAGDQLADQQEEIDDLEEALEEQRRATNDANAAAAERTGLFGRFVETLDELGLTFGWGALYFATLLTWFQGRTPGKRLFGLRVIRMDGETMTLFLAFERSGGYAAGVATGLLGFAQILWDPNRQGIHDKIAGTVVIREGRGAPGADQSGRLNSSTAA